MLIGEFISLVEMWEHDNPLENGRLILDKEEFKEFLETYAFMSFQAKVKVYKTLNFIIHDKTSYTMPHKENGQKKAVRKVIINYQTYQVIKALL